MNSPIVLCVRLIRSNLALGTQPMLTIGKLAKQAGVSTDTVRFYERQGLIAPATKTATGYRLFAPEALRELAFIKHAQRCGFSLSEIREMHRLAGSPGEASREACDIAIRKKREIEDTIVALQSMSLALTSLVDLLTTDPASAAPARQQMPFVQALEQQIAAISP